MAHLLDIVMRLLHVKTEINVVVALQETLPRSWGSYALVSYLKTEMIVVVAVQERRLRS